MAKKSIIGLKKYSKKYNKILFDEIDIELKGKFVLLSGENGSGKTTIMKKLYELNKDRVSYIEQNFFLFENATGKENIEIVDKKIDIELLRALGIDSIYKKKISKMSSGERQRIICYIALTSQSDWLFLDEIDNHLDLKNSKKFYALLCKKKCNLLIISHHQSLLEEFCDQKLHIENKKIISSIKNDNLFKENQTDIHKKISLLKMFFRRCLYLVFLFLNIILMIVSIFFSNINIENVNDKYYSDIFNLQVEPIIYDNGVEITSNYNTLNYLDKVDDMFNCYYLDINQAIGEKNGIYLGNTLLKNGYLQDLFNGRLEFDETDNELEIYLSNYYIDKEIEPNFILVKELFINEEKYTINLCEEIKIKGYLDIPKDYYIYDYVQLEKFLNYKIIIDNIGIIDLLKRESYVLENNFSPKFVGVLKKHLLYIEIGDYIKLGEYSLYINSTNLLNYKNEYRNFILNQIIYKSLSIISLILMLAINVYYIEYFKKKKTKILSSFYKIYGINYLDIKLMKIAIIIIFLPFIFSLLAYLFL